MNKHAEKPDWTVLLHDELGQRRRLDQVRAHVQAGLSAAEIAGQFAGTTRDAVLGFCRRNGLRLARGCWSGRSRLSTHGGGTKRAKAKLKPAPLPDMVVVAHGPGVPLLEIGRHMCRAPLWDDEAHDCTEFLFCGAKVRPGESYCPAHRAQFHAPLPDPAAGNRS